jgi:hypothetical protein
MYLNKHSSNFYLCYNFQKTFFQRVEKLKRYENFSMDEQRNKAKPARNKSADR